MRVLLVGSGFGGWFSQGFEPFVARALRRLGCSVTFVPLQAAARLAKAAGPVPAGAVWRGPATPQWDVILALSGEHLDVGTALALRAVARRSAVWVTEDPYTIDRRRGRWAEAFDVVLTNERACVDEYGPGRGVYLPWCTDPDAFRPTGADPHLSCDVLFVGTGFPERVRLLNALVPHLRGLTVRLVGAFERWGARALLDPWLRERLDAPVFDQEALARLYASAAVVLNVHRSGKPRDALPEDRNTLGVPAQSPNNRVFDVAACGAFQLVDRRPALAGAFDEGREMVTFSSAEDLATKLEWYLARPAQRQAIARAARARVLAQHTYVHRLRTVLARLGQLGPASSAGTPLREFGTAGR